ncbi:hypothetical protein Tco_0871474 [Tanacetum coccineum]
MDEDSANMVATSKVPMLKPCEYSLEDRMNNTRNVILLGKVVNEPIVCEPTVKKPIVEASKAKPKAVRKNNGAPLIEDWVSDNEEDDVP